jgi:hypothetical protein
MSSRKLFAAKSLFALAMAIAGAHFLHDLDHNAVISAAGALSTISGVLFGFVLASVTMLSSFDSSKGIVGALKSNGEPPHDGWKSCCYAPRTMIGNG